MATTNKFVPVNPVHPTDVLLRELRARGIKRGEFAKRIGMQASNFSRLCHSKGVITASLANKFELALDIPAYIWLGLQASYERDVIAVSEREREESEAVAIEAQLASRFNLKEMMKRLSLDGYSFVKDRIKDLYNQLCVDSLDDVFALLEVRGAFKRSERYDTDDKQVATWLLLAHCECMKHQPTVPYVRGNARKVAEELGSLANARLEDVGEEEIGALLGRYGIGYGFVKKLDKAPIDAFSMIYGGIPYVVTSHRVNSMPRLIFDILHELGHIELHLNDGERNVSVDDGLENKAEREANRFAEDALIARMLWKKILSCGSESLNPYVVFDTIVKCAEAYGINPLIAEWRYKHDTGIYNIRGSKNIPIKVA